VVSTAFIGAAGSQWQQARPGLVQQHGGLGGGAVQRVGARQQQQQQQQQLASCAPQLAAQGVLSCGLTVTAVGSSPFL
jgi:hypothetical protein